MAQFNIYFFKEKSRQIDLDELINYFESIEGITIDMDEQSVRFNYLHPRLGYQAQFLITPKSTVPDIYRLNPKFLDLNFHLSMPILTPDFVTRHLMEMVKRITERFNFHVYNEMLEDVLPFKMDVLLKVFSMVKEAYIEKNPVLLGDYHLLGTEKLSAVLRYLDDLVELQAYYKDLETYVPRYHFLSNENKDLAIGIEWKEQTLTVFPPYLDYVFYRLGDTLKVVPCKEAMPLLEKHLLDVPGFIKGTKVVPKKTAKKVFRIMKKTKFSQVGHTFQKASVRHLID
ncbi:MAG: hypothetical protein EA375_02585 [Acholeplasmataceae bacterium]|nr:MAG: hypothetical protein EA375_02585 [Acholeplasmataceae bacterium]